MKKYIKISTAAKKYSISTRTLRYYEEVGLISSIRNEYSNYREYDEQNISKLEQIILLRNLNFSLTEIKDIVMSNDNSRIIDYFMDKQRELDKKLNEINNLKDILNSLLRIITQNGIEKVNIYNLLKEQIYVYSRNERKIEINTDAIIIEFGTAVIPIADKTKKKNLLKSISEMRIQLEKNSNKKLPLIRVRDNEKLHKFQCKIFIYEKEVACLELTGINDNAKIDEIMKSLSSSVEKYM